MIEVPATLMLSMSPAKVPPVIFTVAWARSRLSGSDTEALPDRVTAAPFSVNVASVVPVRVGGSLTGVMPIVVVWTVLVLLEALPSSSSQVTVDFVH